MVQGLYRYGMVGVVSNGSNDLTKMSLRQISQNSVDIMVFLQYGILRWFMKEGHLISLVFLLPLGGFEQMNDPE